MFDVTVQAIDLQVAAITEVEENPHVLMALIIGIALPTATGIQHLPVGAIKALMGRAAALDNAKKLSDAAEELPEEKLKSDLVVASDLRQVDRAAAMAEQFRGGPAPRQ